MIRITYSKTFLKRYKKLTKGNTEISKKVERFVGKFLENPFYSGLKTHKIFLEGGHEGKHSVYR